MKILRAIGLGLVIIILQLLVPRVFHSAEDAFVATFNTAQVVMGVARDTITSLPKTLNSVSPH
jgi:hypothetical protein